MLHLSLCCRSLSYPTQKKVSGTLILGPSADHHPHRGENRFFSAYDVTSFSMPLTGRDGPHLPTLLIVIGRLFSPAQSHHGNGEEDGCYLPLRVPRLKRFSHGVGVEGCSFVRKNRTLKVGPVTRLIRFSRLSLSTVPSSSRRSVVSEKDSKCWLNSAVLYRTSRKKPSSRIFC